MSSKSTIMVIAQSAASVCKSYALIQRNNLQLVHPLYFLHFMEGSFVFPLTSFNWWAKWVYDSCLEPNILLISSLNHIVSYSLICRALNDTTYFYIPVLFSISMTPAGVAGIMDFRSTQNRPTLTTWNPSTSFSGATWLHTVLSLIWGGTGSCTRTPSTSESLFSSSIWVRSWSWVVAAGSLIVSLSIPAMKSLNSF